MIRVTTIVGTRPELIRLSRVIARLDDNCSHALVHTGQNYDPGLNQVFFEELGIRAPDHSLEINTSTLGEMLGTLFSRTETVLAAEQPDAVLVLGDTNSALSALIAKRMGITVFHMEAGNRCFDANVPEETNRRVIDHFADINLVYTEHARRNLLAEGLHPRHIYLTGSPLREVLDHNAERIRASDVLEQLGLERDGFLLLSMHREENVDDPVRLKRLLESVSSLAVKERFRVIVSTHPRTRKRISELGSWVLPHDLEFLPPFGYFDYIALQRGARCVISDSGSVSEEAAILGFPAVTIRNSTERPEALDSGSITLAGTTEVGLATTVAMVLRSWDAGERPEMPFEYTIADCSRRAVNMIVGVTPLQPIWDGIDRPRRDRAR